MEPTANPGKLENPADCARLAEFEWDNNEVDRALWKDRTAYVAQRVPALKARLPRVNQKEESNNADLSVNEEDDPGLARRRRGRVA